MKFNVLFAIGSFMLLILAAGCTGTQTSSAGSGGPAATGASSVAAGSNLVPGPTESVPEAYSVTIVVQEKDYLGSIPVIFDGGNGQVHLKYGTVRLTRADGQVITGQLGNKKGDEVDLQGTKETDRVEVWITMDNGQTYKVIDQLAKYRTRG
jgi:hypothetical protein